MQSDERILNAACALEMIHTYSLIHDDLPAMDNDNLRRGKPTSHVAFDEATAILAGDALLTLAFHVLSKSVSRNDLDKNSRSLEVIHLLSSAAGYQGMVEGQMRDMVFEGVKLKLEDLRALHMHKTGALIEASVCCGAILAGASSNTIKQLKNYAMNIGLAFQVVDDILNVEGDPALLGKSVGTDQIRQKNTYPEIIGLQSSKIMAHELVEQGLQAISDFGDAAVPLREIALYIIQRKR
jgi:geranylgeranyl diphosphate synthase type II